MLASEKGYADTVNVLLKLTGIDVNMKNKVKKISHCRLMLLFSTDIKRYSMMMMMVVFDMIVW